MVNYIAVIHKEDELDYGVSFPDFLGCITAGSTVDEAKNMAQEALDLHIQGMREDGENIPDASTLDVVVKNPDFAGAVAFFVVGIKDELVDETVRFNASMSKRLLADIDSYARSIGMDRSKFLARAAKHEIQSRAS